MNYSGMQYTSILNNRYTLSTLLSKVNSNGSLVTLNSQKYLFWMLIVLIFLQRITGNKKYIAQFQFHDPIVLVCLHFQSYPLPSFVVYVPRSWVIKQNTKKGENIEILFSKLGFFFWDQKYFLAHSALCSI